MQIKSKSWFIGNWEWQGDWRILPAGSWRAVGEGVQEAWVTGDGVVLEM